MSAVEVKAELAGMIWKIVSTAGQTVTEGDDMIIIESMKMEIPVAATASGRVSEILVDEGATVSEGTVLALIET
jgi:acetyl-CoA carboxylase biotin carboxyl carrier protein